MAKIRCKSTWWKIEGTKRQVLLNLKSQAKYFFLMKFNWEILTTTRSIVQMRVYVTRDHAIIITHPETTSLSFGNQTAWKNWDVLMGFGPKMGCRKFETGERRKHKKLKQV